MFCETFSFLFEKFFATIAAILAVAGSSSITSWDTTLDAGLGPSANTVHRGYVKAAMPIGNSRWIYEPNCAYCCSNTFDRVHAGENTLLNLCLLAFVGTVLDFCAGNFYCSPL